MVKEVKRTPGTRMRFDPLAPLDLREDIFEFDSPPPLRHLPPFPHAESLIIQAFLVGKMGQMGQARNIVARQLGVFAGSLPQNEAIAIQTCVCGPSGDPNLLINSRTMNGPEGVRCGKRPPPPPLHPHAHPLFKKQKSAARLLVRTDL